MFSGLQSKLLKFFKVKKLNRFFLVCNRLSTCSSVTHMPLYSVLFVTMSF